MGYCGLLYSQIGYDIGDPMRALIRTTEDDRVPEGTRFSVVNVESEAEVAEGPVKYSGEIWKSHFFELDFSGIDSPGSYRISVTSSGEEIFASDAFEIGRALLFEKTVRTVALDQLEERGRRARNQKGWKDCGSDFREANSHATMIIGLCDLAGAYDWISDSDQKRLYDQMVRGCDYLGACQDKAAEIGFPEGAVVHEIPNYMTLIPGDVAQSAVAFAKASRLLTEVYPEKSDEYLKRAIKAYEFLLNDAKPHGPAGFSAMNHGAPEDYEVPDEFMTRDLLMMMFAGVELWISGQLRYQDSVVKLARKVMRRQVKKERSEGGFYGHFYTFDHSDFTEKANVHHHVGHDTGATFPYYLIPFVEILGRWYDHRDAPLWRRTLEDFGYGFLLPACEKNPFRLIPEGYFKDEGILFFCGPWHGTNTSIAFGAALASKLASVLGDRRFHEIAVGNIQWIAGLNAGLTKDSFEGSVFFKAEIGEGEAVPFSQIQGVGNRSVGVWTDIPGSIANGFCVNPQFQLKVKPSAEADGPWLFSDEDWIPHAGGWLTGLTFMRQYKVYAG